MSVLTDFIDHLISFISHPLTMEKLSSILDERAASRQENLDWRNSIVDLLKVADKDSSLEARQKMARDLGYLGPIDGSAAMNIWLHQQVMSQLAKTLK